MSTSPALPHCDADWGCDHFDLTHLNGTTVYACRVEIADIAKLASELAKTVIDTSWMSTLDHGARRTYESTVSRTADLLREIFESMDPGSPVAGEFGEMMVSIGSARALSVVFSHSRVPLAELWKPQLKQNGGFDFHTVCEGELIHFGEAKFASSGNPWGLAIAQADEFLHDQKHLRDRSDLVNLVSPGAITRLDADEFGVVAAFSLNAENQDRVISNAVSAAVTLASKYGIKQVFVVGVSHVP
ncbi:hypothetical protein ACF3M1_09965 [Luteimonas sp. WGS1318]|uniref:hypothetical protein n=1 Tax=Luteimonas sp. WGS1318 TaxID=3366815 RepID=UPI00372CFDF0